MEFDGTEYNKNLCDKKCNEYDYAECPGTNGPCIMIEEAPPAMTAERLAEVLKNIENETMLFKRDINYFIKLATELLKRVRVEGK